MGDLLRILLDTLSFVWPLRIVDQWEKAGYYVCGRWWKETGPGLKVVMPWFTHVEPVSISLGLAGCGRQDITLKDGTVLSFSATATLRVIDVFKALNEVEHYKDSTQELIGSYLAEKLASMDVEKFEPSKRSATMRQLRDGLASEAAEFGVEITKLRFNSFVLKARTYRLLTDGAASPW